MSDDMEIEKRLGSIEQKIDENSKILRSIKRKQFFSFWFGVTKILIFVGLFYYAYVFVEPLIIQVKEFYASVQNISETSQSFKEFNIFEFFKQNMPQQ